MILLHLRIHVSTPSGQLIAVPEGGRLVFGRGRTRT